MHKARETEAGRYVGGDDSSMIAVMIPSSNGWVAASLVQIGLKLARIGENLAPSRIAGYVSLIWATEAAMRQTSLLQVQLPLTLDPDHRPSVSYTQPI